MKADHVLAGLFLIFLAGCGGGGGGGGGTPPPSGNTPPPAGETPPDDDTPPAGSTGSSTARIVFPSQRSSALASSLVVRGKASDPDGVAAVRVNGVEAVLVSASGEPVTAKSVSSRVQAISESHVQDNHEEGEVEWSIEVELDTGENDLVVTVEDDTGEETDDIAEAMIKYAKVPERFTYDRGDPRLLGWNFSLTPSGYVTQLVEYDYATEEQTTYAGLTDLAVASCFRSSTNELLYVFGDNASGWEVRSFDLTTHTGRLLSDISAPMAPGPGFSNGPMLIEIACSGVHDRAYVLANYWDGGDKPNSRIIKVELSGNAEVLAETDPDELPPWSAYTIALGSDALVSVSDIVPNALLTRIAFEDGARTPLAPSVLVGGLAVTAALELDRVYVTTFAGVDEINLATESKRNVSVVEQTDPLIFSQPDSIALDLVNNRVIVGDSDLDVLVAVDLATGDRSELLSRNIGDGPPMIVPRSIVVDAAGAMAYVVDDGGVAPEKLFEIDLGTGDRRAIGQIHEPGVNRSLTGVALDEQGGFAYVSRLDGDALLQVDLETEVATPFTSIGDGLLENVADILFDAGAQRLLVADSTTDAIVAVDIVSRQKELISRGGERGEGPSFGTLVSMTMAEDGASVYIGDQATDQVMRVNLETGDREVVETTCALGSSETLRQVLHDAAGHELLILSDGLFAFDLETSGCTKLPSQLIPLGIALTPDGRLLASDFNQLMQLDMQSADAVIVSK